jgi:membrane-associated protease RseP (regulator of RpoE activity)
MPLDSVVAMLNFDMVGRMRDDRLIVYGVETATEMRDVVGRANTGMGADSVRVSGVGDGFGPSDHASFYGKNIPVLHFFTDIHDDYHRATDDAERINAGGIGRVVRLAERVVRDLGDRPGRLTFQQAAPRPVAARQGSGVYLGTIPDMGAADVEGMRLTGVRAGSPADSAGMRAGDVIVRFGDHAVTDIYTYTDAMNAYQPGDEVNVEVIRDGQRVAVRVRLARRGE